MLFHYLLTRNCPILVQKLLQHLQGKQLCQQEVLHDFDDLEGLDGGFRLGGSDDSL